MTDLAKKKIAYEELSKVYNVLDSIVDILKDSQPSNIGNQLPVAEEFVQTATNSMNNIVCIYCDIMERGGDATQRELLETEKQINHFFDGLKKVLDACREFDRQGSEYFAGRNDPPELKKIMRSEDRIEVFNQLLRREGYMQQQIYEEARRLGSDRGGRMLLAVDDCALQLLDAVRAMVVAGVPVDLNHVQGKEARPEFFGMKAPPFHKQEDKPEVVQPVKPVEHALTTGKG